LIDEWQTCGRLPRLVPNPAPRYRCPMIRTSSSAAPAANPKSPRNSSSASREAAEALAAEALGFVAADPELLSRFLAVTGIEATEIRAAARAPGFLAGVLSFIAAHEPTLLAFAAAAGRQPPDITAAIAALPGGAGQFERST
jgi:hypothetical protein